MKKLLLIFILTTSLYAKEYGDMVLKQTVRIHDGDTLETDFVGCPDVLGKGIGIRISGVDTPELKSKSEFLKNKSIQAREFTFSKIRNSKVITLHKMTRDKYAGRIGAYVLIDGKDLGKMLIENKLGYEYYGGKKKSEQEQEKVLK